MKIKITCIVIVVVCISLLVYQNCYKKQAIYIGFEDLQGFSYYFKKDSLGQDSSIILKQEGDLSYISWELKIDNYRIEKKELYFVEEVDIVSQYWIINNISGMQIATNSTKTNNYNIYVIKEQDGSLYLYPISVLNYIIE